MTKGSEKKQAQDEKEPSGDGSADAGSPPPAAATTGLEQFGAATKESREAAKWLVAGFGAIGAALVAGTQLSSIGALEDTARLTVAIVALAVGLMAAGAGAAITMWVLLPGYTSLPAVAKAEEAGKHWRDFAYFGDVVTASPNVGQGYATTVAGPKGLLALIQSALDERAARYAEYLEAYQEDRADLPAKARTFEVANERAMELGRVGTDVVTAASYRRLNRGARPWVIAIVLLALIIGVALGVFAWAANPADKEADTTSAISLRGAVLVGSDLSGRDLTNVDLEGATLTNMVLRGTKLDPAKVKNVTWNDVICPDGTSSGDHGTCLGHLE